MGNSTKEVGPLREELAAQFPGRVSSSAAVRAAHGRDESYHAHHAPDLVVFPESTQEVSLIASACHRRSVPMIAFGAGTSLEGGVLALSGGVSIDLSRMSDILHVHAEDQMATVQAGVRRKQLNESLRGSGLWFPIDPGVDATLGGMAATRASGTTAVKYGTMRRNVVCATVVLADGTAIRTANRAPKSSAGYDLTGLFVGSEGTLGIITELTVRLYGLPVATRALRCPFPSAQAAVDTVVATIQYGLDVARIEYLDARMMSALNRHSKSGYPEAPTLFVEFHGTEAGCEESVTQFASMATEFGMLEVRIARSPDEQRQMWASRHDALYATKALRPAGEVLITDVCVPLSGLAECVEDADAIVRESSLPFTIVGHVGDGNFHVFIVVDPASKAEIGKAEVAHRQLARRAIACGGTCTGEHGIGVGKKQLLREELGEAVDVMARLKRALDPANLMNPGKIF